LAALAGAPVAAFFLFFRDEAPSMVDFGSAVSAAISALIVFVASATGTSPELVEKSLIVMWIATGLMVCVLGNPKLA
jgi:hypothetical protein